MTKGIMCFDVGPTGRFICITPENDFKFKNCSTESKAANALLG